MSKLTEDAVRAQLKKVTDPALDNKDLVALRQVKSVKIKGDNVTIGIELVTPAYPQNLRDELYERIKSAVADAGAGKVSVDFTAQTAARPASERLPGVKNIIAVAAGKGGVGKSTVATNLALALLKHGASVGILDNRCVRSFDSADARTAQGRGDDDVRAKDHSSESSRHLGDVDRVLRREGQGGRVARADGASTAPAVPRGRGVGRARLPDLRSAAGTGDVQLSLSQLIPITGSVMVTTPQEVALIDVIKGIQMFDNVAIPVFGVVENMAYYTCTACGHHDDIFSRGGGRRLARDHEIEFLGELPLDAKVRFGGDSGVPVILAAPESEHATTFMDIASKVALAAARKNLAQGKRSAGLTVLR